MPKEHSPLLYSPLVLCTLILSGLLANYLQVLAFHVIILGVRHYIVVLGALLPLVAS